MQRSSGRQWGGRLAVLSAVPDARALRRALDRIASDWPALREGRRRTFVLATPTALPAFDLDYHVRWESLRDDEDPIAVANRRFFEPLDERRPAWELHVLAGPQHTVVLVKMADRIEPAGVPAPLLSALVSAPAARELEPRPSAAPPVLTGRLEQAGDAIAGLLRLVEDSQAALRESAAMLAAAARGMPPSTADLKETAWRAARAVASTIAAPLANPLPSSLVDSVTGSLRLALVDLPVAALDAARAPFGLELADVLVSLGAATMTRLEGRSRSERRAESSSVRALVSAPRRGRVVLSGRASNPFEGACEVHRLRSAPDAAAAPPLARARRSDVASALAALPETTPAPYDLSVCYDRIPLAGCRLAGAEIQRVYPIGSAAREARLSIGAQRSGERLSVGLTFSTAVAQEPAELLRAFTESSTEFITAAETARPAAHS